MESLVDILQPNDNASISILTSFLRASFSSASSIHPIGAIIGDTIVSGTKVPISMGNALPLSAV